MATTRQWEIQNQRFGRRYTVFFADFLSAQKMVRVIAGKIIWKWSEGQQKFLLVSGRFELSGVSVLLVYTLIRKITFNFSPVVLGP